MAPELNARAAAARPSPTMGAAAGATAHPDPISLAQGEPAEPPPPEVLEAGRRALAEGHTRYGPAAGLGALRERLALEHARRSGVPTTADEVVVTVGGKAALMDALRCVLEPGDEVLVPAPYWPTFLAQVEWCGARAVVVPGDPDGLPDPERVAAAAGERTRVLIVNSPNNPTGRVWPARLLRALAELAEQRDLWLLSDEVYRALALEGEAPGLLHAYPAAAARTVVIESFSKRFAMTGLRVGAAIGPRALIAAMTRLASAATTHPCSVSQYMALAALGLDGSWEAAQRARYRARRDRAAAALGALEGVRCPPSEAAFYLFPDVAGWIAAAGLADDAALAASLRETRGLLLTPGSAFGAPGRLRLSYGLADGRLDEALARLRGD